MSKWTRIVRGVGNVFEDVSLTVAPIWFLCRISVGASVFAIIKAIVLRSVILDMTWRTASMVCFDSVETVMNIMTAFLPAVPVYQQSLSLLTKNLTRKWRFWTDSSQSHGQGESESHERLLHSLGAFFFLGLGAMTTPAQNQPRLYFIPKIVSVSIPCPVALATVAPRPVLNYRLSEPFVALPGPTKVDCSRIISPDLTKI